MVGVLAPPSLRDRKKQLTRQALHNAALALTEAHGLAAVTIEAIAERADVAPRTFFNYYPTKVDAVLGRDPDRPDRLRRAIEARPAREAPLTTLREVMVEDLLSGGISAEHLRRRIRVIRAEPHLHAAIAAHFEEMERSMVLAIAARLGLDPDTDLYPSLVVAAATSAARVAFLCWSDRGGNDPAGAALRAAFDQLAAGLDTPLDAPLEVPTA
ncbi:MAG: TetR/AcrR family transcriptional regulator [Acidimicrobiales bacterium]